MAAAPSVVESHSGEEWERSELRELAQTYSVSQEVVLRRLLILGLTTQAFYDTIRRQFLSEYRSRVQEKGFVPPSVDAVSTAGKPFITAILDAYDSDRITGSDVSDYIGVNLKHLGRIAELVGRG